MADKGEPRLPLYAQVEDLLASQIESGTLPVGVQLPSEDELIRQFNVSRTTVRTTIQNLVRRGYVEIRRGKGTFVASTKMVQELNALTGFVEDMRVLGRVATTRVVSRDIVPADRTVAAKLALNVDAEVVRIRRVRLSDDVPLSFDETYLPVDVGRQIMADDLVAYPIFTLLEERYATPLIEADYELEASIATGLVARELDVAPGSSIFLIERTSLTLAHRPVDYERLYYRGDRIRFKTRLVRRHGEAGSLAVRPRGDRLVDTAKARMPRRT